MKLVQSAARSGNELNWPNGIPDELGYYKANRLVLVAAVTFCFVSSAFGQTTRTSPSASSTAKSIPSSSSTSPSAPCYPMNPTSPCYSANAPRNPCYSAVAPNDPCSTTVTPSSQSGPPPATPATSAGSKAPFHALTADQAKARIEANGFSNVSELRRDTLGIWRGKAEKDGLMVDVTLDRDGNASSN